MKCEGNEKKRKTGWSVFTRAVDFHSAPITVGECEM